MKKLTRRDLLTTTAATAALTALPAVHAQETHTVHLALIGCGGRGSGAAVNAFESPNGPVKLVAMADLFDLRLKSAHANLMKRFENQIDVPADRQFIGFDAYRKAIDCLKPGDVAMLTGYAAWRPLQLEYAVSKGINVFMEKSFACDPPGVRRLIAAGEAAKKKNLKIAAGLMCRHSKNRQELIQRIRDGELGDIMNVRAYRMQPVGPLGPKPPAEKELNWQIRNFTKFIWVSGGLFAEMDIHQMDEIFWIKNAFPVMTHGTGGRIAGSTDRSQNLDSFHAEFTFADGTLASDTVRYLPSCHNEFATYIHGTKKSARFSGNGHDSNCAIYKDRRIAADNIEWKAKPEEFSLWHAEWNVLLDAIKSDKPHNEAERAGHTNLGDIMARAAIHTGQQITWDQALASNFQFCPNLDQLNENSDPPLQPDPNGYYPCPAPGKWKEL